MFLISDHELTSYKAWIADLEHWKNTSTTKIIGKSLVLLKTVNSTNKYLKSRPNLPHGSVVIAYEQVSGKGQKNRQWSSLPGGLYLTIKL